MERAAKVSAPIAKGYGDAGASHKKKALKGFTAQSGSPREDIDWNNYTLRQRGRMLYMSTPIARSAINTNRTNVIGMGLQFKSKIDHAALGMTPEAAAAWQRKTEAEFALWAENKQACDATGVNDFYSMQQLALSSWLMSGDCFVVFKQKDPTKLMPYGLRLHIVEADRVRTPGAILSTDSINPETKNRIFDGVEVDDAGAIVAYHISNTYPNEYTAQMHESVRVEAYGKETGLPNIIQLMDSERPDQYRGVSYLAPVIEPLLQIRRYTDSELTAANIEASFSAWITTNEPANEMPFNEVGWGDVDGFPGGDGQVSRDPNEYELGPGTVNIMEPGEGVTFADPKRPGSGFAGFVEAISTQVGAALEIPKELLLKCFNSSYSASRAALLEAWKMFQMFRKWFASDFCKPIYERWLTEAIARGRILAPGFFTDPIIHAAYLGSKWIGPSQGMLDPTKEINAEIMAIGMGFSTHEQSTIKLNGGQWHDNVTQLAIEEQLLKDAGLKKSSISIENEDKEDANE